MTERPAPNSVQWHAAKAMRNAISRSRKHMANGRPYHAANALERGARTARKWLDGEHPSQHQH